MKKWYDDWEDVIPTLPEREKSSFMRIVMTEEDELLYSVFHDVVLRGERSLRAFELTNKLIAKNSGDYTAWWLRKKCMEAKMAPCSDEEELCFIQDCITDCPKSYQTWNYRRWLMTDSPLGTDPDVVLSELASCSDNLEDDSKNHCAWQYRQFLFDNFKLDLKPEIDYVEQQITLDPRNNSAWNYRVWLLEKGQLTLPSEVEFCLKWIKRTPHNESPFNCLMSLLDHKEMASETKSQIFEDLQQIAREAKTGSDHYAMEAMQKIKSQEVTLEGNSVRSSYYKWINQQC